MIKKEEAKRYEDKKSKYDDNSMGTSSQTFRKKRNTKEIHVTLTPPQKQCVSKQSSCNQWNHHHKGDCYFYNMCNEKGYTTNFCRNSTPTTLNQSTDVGEITRVATSRGKTCYGC